jgi:hypothetical protein
MGYTRILDRHFDLPDKEAMELSRRIAKNNQGLYAHYNIGTTETFLPHVLVYLGLFESGSQVKKNRKDLWRDVVDQEVLTIGKIVLRIHKVVGIIEVEEIEPVSFTSKLKKWVKVFWHK